MTTVIFDSIRFIYGITIVCSKLKSFSHCVTASKKPIYTLGYRNVLERLSTTPGPGSYTVGNTLNQTKAYTFGSRPEQKVRSDTPAPNSYSTENSNFTRTPSFTFGGRRKVEKPMQTPGIFAFSLCSTACYSRIFNLSLYSFLAPNQYQPDFHKQEYQPAFSFGSRPEEKIKSNTPGRIHIDTCCL